MSTDEASRRILLQVVLDSLCIVYALCFCWSIFIGIRLGDSPKRIVRDAILWPARIDWRR